jgi:hypothetical protein
MSEVFITRKGGGGKASAPELLITEVGGSWIEVEVTNTDQVQSAQIFLLVNYDPNSEEDFDFLAIQNGKVITVAAGATATEFFSGLDNQITYTISAQAAVIKKLPSNIVTTGTINLAGTGLPVPTIATSNITDFSFDYSVTNNESTIPVDFKIAITTSTAVPTNYPISQTNVGPNATINLNATNLNAGTTYYIHARALDGTVESNNIFVSVSTISALYAFSSWTFTNAGQTGNTGPNINQVRSAYSSQTWAQNNSYLSMTHQGIQEWTAPASGTYSITIAGAPGATNLPNNTSTTNVGLGAVLFGNVTLNRGVTYNIVIGQRATPTTSGDTANGGGSGGGGTFMYVKSNQNIVAIAGGGGGQAIQNVSGSNVVSETYGINGQSGTTAASFNYLSTKTIFDSYYKASNGANGGRWSSNQPTPNAFTGGKGFNTMSSSNNFNGDGAGSYGSFGGFGGGSNTADHNGGGGGGYSGGGTVGYAIFPNLARTGGGGGSSFTTGSVSYTGTNADQGYLTVTKL